MKFTLTIVLIFGISGALFAQSPGNVLERDTKVRADTNKLLDLIDVGRRLLHIRIRKPEQTEGKSVYFSALPFSNQVPGGGTALVTSTTAGFYLGDRADTYISRVTFTPYWNFKQRYGLPIRSSIWLPRNRWVITGDTRLMIYPQYTWGLGRQYKQDEKLLVNYSYIRFYQQALKRLARGFFMGVGYHIDYRANVRTNADEALLADYTKYPYGTGQKIDSYSSGLSFNTLFDTRNNSFNPLDGYYVSLQYRLNPVFLGNKNQWSSLYLDFRKYIRFDPTRERQNMLAVWSYLWKVIGNKVPYLDLPSIGWEDYNRSGRGFDQNRFRGRNLLYVETEYRRDITNNGFLGFVVFANANTVSGPKSTFLLSWNPGAGAGLRIKMNKKSGTNIALNYGFSKGYSGVKLTLGEVF
ncbi:BamA/TamA family outer membrane protein [Dyadobacter luticola]|uniref:BamA/TamA family outer membrane protein n=1 Tax=Dyadobacter luticola TaxID=1979387 RepID=UPI00197A79D0|nr:BamA/TamA family outer membrane protein [Dyadobacter luticola]